ncbi:MAG TPA: hypothetical protein VNA88_19345 [Candidatus Kapabacteria bacterium]|jgi:hypothetical protein|nr:hypothetical protein [Candidatus Kapabacteria bacterium]
METGVIVAIAIVAGLIFFAIVKRLMKLAFFIAIVVVIVAMIYSFVRP